MPNLSTMEIRELARAYFEQAWAKARELVYLGADDPAFDPKIEAEEAQGQEAGLRKHLVQQVYDHVTKIEAQELLAAHGYAAGTIPLESMDELYNAILRAKIDVRRILAAMLTGKYENAEPHDPLFRDIEQPPLPPIPGDGDAPVKQTVASLTDKYCTQNKASKWVKKTYNENRRVLDWFVDYVGGSKPIKAVTLEDVRDYRDALLALPSNFAKAKKFHGMLIKEIVAAAKGEPKLAPKTAQKYYFNLKGFLNWCVNEGYLDKNPAGNLKISVKVNESEARYPFSKDQLNKLFKSPQYTGHLSEKVRGKPGEMLVRDGRFWIPIVGLFTGMRLGEIVQLWAADIKEKDDIVYFDISLGEGEDKQLKTKSSQRVVPIHPELAEFGFLAFVEERRKKSPKGRLFEDIKQGKDGYYSHNFSKYFSRYLKQAGIKTPKTVFHSFRHTFTDALRDAGVEDSHMKALLGHADQSVTAQYGSKYSPTVLAKDVAKVDFGVDLDHLKPA